jgi:two-component system chemotaxis response regulator CheB
VVIGGSAGGLAALRRVVSRLPADFSAPILVTLHLASDAESRLAEILSREGPLAVRNAVHGDPLKPGEVLVARPNRHLVVYDDAVQLSRGPRENRHRPSVDALFNSAARAHGQNVIGVILSGALDDGAAGCAAIAAQDGVVIVQEPTEAHATGMPKAAIRAVRRARVTPIEHIAAVLTELAQQPEAESPGEVNEMTQRESADVARIPAEAHPPGTPSALGCPECQGGMFEIEASGALRYVCHVGHSWSPSTLLAAQREASEGALYNAASKLLEEAAVLRRLASRTDPSAGEQVAEYERLAADAQRRANDIQNMISGAG